MQLTRLGLLVLLCGVPIFAAGVTVAGAGVLGAAWMGVWVVVAVADSVLARRAARFEVSREVDDKLSLGAENSVALHLRSRCSRALRLAVKDTPPLAFDTPSRLRHATLPPQGEASVRYLTTPRSRGDFGFGDVFVRGVGRLRLSTWQVRFATAAPVKVYPNLLQVRRYELLARADRLREMGFRTLRIRGEGTQFESLRDYVPDDEYRDIEWKATARKRKPITRQYEIERSQNVMLLLDAGRMMLGEVGGMTKLDYAVNAALMLAHVACRKDDAVGLVAFGRRVESFVPPRKGTAQVGRILEQLYSLQPALEEPDYRAAFALLSGRARKRALVVIFTDLVDADASQRLLAHVIALHPRHLPLLVTLRDTDLERMAARVPEDEEQAYQKAIAAQTLAARDAALAAVRTRGALVLDVAPGELTVQAVNEYLRLKAAGRL